MHEVIDLSHGDRQQNGEGYDHLANPLKTQRPKVGARGLTTRPSLIQQHTKMHSDGQNLIVHLRRLDLLPFPSHKAHKIPPQPPPVAIDKRRHIPRPVPLHQDIQQHQRLHRDLHSHPPRRRPQQHFERDAAPGDGEALGDSAGGVEAEEVELVPDDGEEGDGLDGGAGVGVEVVEFD